MLMLCNKPPTSANKLGLARELRACTHNSWLQWQMTNACVYEAMHSPAELQCWRSATRVACHVHLQAQWALLLLLLVVCCCRCQCFAQHPWPQPLARHHPAQQCHQRSTKQALYVCCRGYGEEAAMPV
jgi:hypothetical protein